MTTKEKMIELFKVEELEERMEFGEWGTDPEGVPYYTPDWSDIPTL